MLDTKAMLNYQSGYMLLEVHTVRGLACSVDHACEIYRTSNCEGCGEGRDGDLGRDCVWGGEEVSVCREVGREGRGVCVGRGE